VITAEENERLTWVSAATPMSELRYDPDGDIEPPPIGGGQKVQGVKESAWELPRRLLARRGRQVPRGSRHR
jgi:hypothetical protein